jgi:hypothetical protein
MMASVVAEVATGEEGLTRRPAKRVSRAVVDAITVDLGGGGWTGVLSISTAEPRSRNVCVVGCGVGSAKGETESAEGVA